MLEHGRSGSRGTPDRRVTRRVVAALIGAVQVAILALTPLADPPPAPAGHRHHLAAESGGACHVHHDEHCVVCRTLTTDATAASVPGELRAAPPALALAACSPSDAVPDARPVTLRHARAPPLA